MKHRHIARALGLIGLGLGLAEVFAPRCMARMAGLDKDERVIGVFGMREIVTGLLLLAVRDPARAGCGCGWWVTGWMASCWAKA